MSRRLLSYLTVPLIAIATLFAAAAPSADAATLGVGDPAPPIVVKSFIKGPPIKSLGGGRTTVVMFWATWCVNASPNAFQCLHELAKKYPTIRFLAVSTLEGNLASVEPFVESMGSKVNCTVALDSVQDGAPGKTGVMAETWLDAAKKRYIPVAFIVDGHGRIQWSGLPINLDAPLATIAAGKWDAKAARAEFVKDLAIHQSLTTIAKPGDPAQSVGALDALVAKSPEFEPRTAPIKFEFLRKAHDEAEALAYGSRILNVLGKTDYLPLNSMAWYVVDPASKLKPTPAMLTLAMTAAKRADALTAGRNSAVADTLACAQYATGNIAAAIVSEERALKLAKDNRTVAACNARLAGFRYSAIANLK